MTAVPLQEPFAKRLPLWAHVFGIGAATAGFVLCTVLPFLPGEYDALAVALSGLALIFGKVGLALVPVGIVWLAYEMRRGPVEPPGAPVRDKRPLVRLGALILVAVVLFIVSFGAVVGSGLTSMLGLVALWVYSGWRGARWWKRRGRARQAPDRTSPLYLIVVPAAVALLQSALADPVAEFSRNRAIENSKPLIADIERYRATRGHYPQSLLSKYEDYDPAVIGIRRYHYEPSGAAYNLIFDQPSFVLGTHEYVAYNPLDQQVVTSHNEDLLRLSLAQLESTRGFYASHPTSHPHWKSFLFD